MAGELLQAVTSGGEFSLKTLTDTFAAVADRNLKSRELQIRQQEAAQNSVLKGAALDLREQSLSLKTTQAATAAQGRELLNSLNVIKLQNAQQALVDAQHYADDVTAATQDGKSLAVRLKSEDPTEAEDAYRTFAAIRDKYRTSPSQIVINDIKGMESLPIVQQKAELAQKAEERRQTDVQRKQIQGDRRLDQHENIINETQRHHLEQEAQGATRVETGQRNATSRERSVDLREQGGKSADVGITLPNIGHVSMPKIRSVLAAGMAPGATQQQVSDADVLRKSILAVPSGNKNPDTGAIIPRFTNDDIVRWTSEGQAAAKASPTPPAAGASPTPPQSRPGGTPRKRTYDQPAPALPTQDGGNTTAAPQVPPPTAAPAPSSESIIPGLPPMLPDEPAASTPAAPAATPTPASQLLKKYKIPARPTPAPAAGGTASADPSTPDSLYGATQNFLAGLGIVPAPQQMVGFGGFGFGLPPV